MSDIEKLFNEMATKGEWGDAEWFARLVEFLLIQGRAEDFHSIVGTQE